jgi:hypothetical protein
MAADARVEHAEVLEPRAWLEARGQNRSIAGWLLAVWAPSVIKSPRATTARAGRAVRTLTPVRKYHWSTPGGVVQARRARDVARRHVAGLDAEASCVVKEGCESRRPASRHPIEWRRGLDRPRVVSIVPSRAVSVRGGELAGFGESRAGFC